MKKLVGMFENDTWNYWIVAEVFLLKVEKESIGSRDLESSGWDPMK